MNPIAVFILPSPDEAVRREAEAHQARLTKPAGSLGRLEQLAIQAAAWQGAVRPQVRPAAALLFAADHPVAAHGVSAYPSAVTRAMLDNFATGGAAASVLTRSMAIPLHVIDVGVNPKGGAGDIRVEDGLSHEAYLQTLATGASAVDRLPRDTRVLILGEMGIGNTTVAAAVFAALFATPAETFVGRGTGISDAVLARKQEAVAAALSRLGAERDPHTILRRVGGRDIVALLGAMARALELRMLVLIDGFVVTAAAAALLHLNPEARAGLVFTHRSDERAHGHVLERLRVRPLLDLGLRLGEASGALAAFPLLELACVLHAEMATFDSASVPERLDD